MKKLPFLLPYMIFILLISCEENTEEDDSPYSDVSIPVSDAWNPHPDNPVIAFGDSIGYAKWDAPSVLVENGEFIMYLTSNLGDFGEEIVPFNATSSDGVNWNLNDSPLLATGDVPTAIDFNGIESPTVVNFKGMYHMYYTLVPQDVIGSRAIGHATSPDGINWTKDEQNPVLEPSGEITEWNGVQVAEPAALVYNDELYLYFAGQGSFSGDSIPANRSSLGLAISADGYTFDAPEEILYLEEPYTREDGFTGYGSPSAIVHNNRVHLFYDVLQYNENENISLVRVAIHHASSANGKTDWVQNDEAVFVRDNFIWTRREIREPAAVIIDNTIHLWFAGDDLISDNSLWGIGFATADATFIE